MKLKNELMISNLVYNSHESNPRDYNVCREYERDVTFFC